MAMFKRGSLWWVRFTTPVGDRIRKSTKTTNKKEAQEFHDRLKVELWRTQLLRDTPKRTWDDAAARWEMEMQHKADYRKDMAKIRWLSQHLAGLRLDQVDRDRLAAVAAIKSREASPATVNRYLALVRAILRKSANEWGWLEKAPTLRLAPEARRRIRWLTRAQAARLLSELPDHQHDAAKFALATGLRQANVLGLTWDQVDLQRSVAWVHPDQAKGRKAIAVPLNKDAVEVLRKRRSGHETHVFTFKGQPIKQVNTRAWKLALKRAGIEDFRWHDLRHTWASWHVQSGTPLHVLQELGGWESVEMVRRYAHLASEHLAEHAFRVELGTNLTHS